MNRVVLVFGAHAPWRLRRYNYFDIGRSHDYFDRDAMRRRIAGLDAAQLEPAATLLQAALERHPRLTVGLALSGPLLEQLALWAPARISALRRLVETGRAEPLAQTSHRSLLWTLSREEIATRVRAHAERVERLLGRVPRVFGGEEGGDPETLSAALELAGLGGRLGIASNASDAAADPSWLSMDRDGILPLAVDFANVGSPRAMRARDDLGRWLDAAASARIRFLTPSEAVAAGEFEDPAPPPRSTPNELQRDARAALAALDASRRGASDPDAVEDYLRLTGSDHFEAMALSRGRRAPNSPPFDSPYEAYMAFRHAVSDLEIRFGGATPRRASALRMPA